MRSKIVIASIILGLLIVVIAVAAWIVFAFGLRGVIGLAATGALIALIYFGSVRARIGHWGATKDEIRQPMPGDEIIAGANTATRAITIEAPPAAVWPWLVQIGYGRAGWYSYDWIDNDGKPSAYQIPAHPYRRRDHDDPRHGTEGSRVRTRTVLAIGRRHHRNVVPAPPISRRRTNALDQSVASQVESNSGELLLDRHH